MIFLLAANFSYMLPALFINNKRKGSLSDRTGNVSEIVNKLDDNKVVLFTIIWIVFFIISYGPGNIISRTIYIPDYFKYGVAFSYTTVPFISFLMGFVKKPLLRRFLFFAVFLLLLSTSSRLIVIFVLLYFLSGCLRDMKVSYTKLFIFFLVASWLAAYSLIARHLPNQGVLYNLEILFSAEIIKTYVYSINYMTSFSVGVIAYASEFNPPSNFNLYYELNPLPSFIIGENPNNENLIGVAPYSAFSVLYTQSSIFSFFYFFFAGCVFFVIERLNKSLSFSVAHLGFNLTFCFLCLQYTLRASNRIMIYLFVLYLLFIIMNKTFRILRNVR